jgi:hypothetical protein
LSDLEPIAFPGRPAARSPAPAQKDTTFDRRELMRILDLYGRMVAAGEWRDYAIAFMRDRAVFSIFRRSSEQPLYRIEKSPALARKQGRLRRGQCHRIRAEARPRPRPRARGDRQAAERRELGAIPKIRYGLHEHGRIAKAKRPGN